MNDPDAEALAMAVATILANSHRIESRRVIRQYFLREAQAAINTLRLSGFEIVSRCELDRLRDSEATAKQSSPSSY